MIRVVVAAAAMGLAVLALGMWWMAQGDAVAQAGVKVPALSPAAVAGKTLFDANCATCHGENGAGTDKGPPFLHRFYAPGHHGDMAFQIAAKQGVRAHHWRFGNMPPVPGVTPEDVTLIVAYVREVQRANGIR